MSINLAVITPAYNAAKVLRDCLQSVACQTIDCEHLIVDGGSSDDTVSIAREFDHVSHLISERDRGPYHAMNKGIRAASSEVIGVLNSDDMYADPNVLQKVASVFEDQTVEACYGDLVYVKETSEASNQLDARDRRERFEVVRYWESGNFLASKMYWGWMPPHPTFFARRCVYERYGLFKLDQGSASDYELMLRFLLKHRISVAYIPKILVLMRAGGMSNANLRARYKANRMDRRAWKVNGLRPFPWTLISKPLRKIPQWWRRPQNQRTTRSNNSPLDVSSGKAS